MEEDPEEEVPKRKPQTVTILARAVALAMFADGGSALPHRFAAAWSQLPALFQQIADGNGDSAEGVTRYGLVRAIFDADMQRARQGADGYERLPRIAGILDAFDDSAMTDLEITLGDAAFNVGLAMGLYLGMSETPVTYAPRKG